MPEKKANPPFARYFQPYFFANHILTIWMRIRYATTIPNMIAMNSGGGAMKPKYCPIGE